MDVSDTQRRVWLFSDLCMLFSVGGTEKPVQHSMADEERAPYKMIQTIGLSVGAAVAYIIVVLGLMFYCKQRRRAKRSQKSGDEPELECLNGAYVCEDREPTVCSRQSARY